MAEGDGGDGGRWGRWPRRAMGTGAGRPLWRDVPAGGLKLESSRVHVQARYVETEANTGRDGMDVRVAGAWQAGHGDGCSCCGAQGMTRASDRARA